MESVEEPPLLNTPVDGMKITVIFDDNDENAVASVATDVCHKSNGVAESSESAAVAPEETNAVPIEDGKSQNDITVEVVKSESPDDAEEPTARPASEAETTTTETMTVESAAELNQVPTDDPPSIDTESAKDKDEVTETTTEDIKIQETPAEVENIVEPSIDRVTFQTEILVETNDNEIIETVVEETTIEQDTNNLLSELGQSIELSEALRSSDVTDNVENNNCAARQEMFNKEELLDILEGNDEEQPQNVISSNFKNIYTDKITEAQLAYQQLSRLKRKPKKAPRFERLSRSRKSEKKHIKQEHPQDKSEVAEPKTEENLVNVLVKEWDDEEASEVEKSNKLLEESENLIESTNEVVITQEAVTKEPEDVSIRASIDSSSEGKTTVLNKSSDEGQPQRRLGRVIKKKVIFDPDNPDTFTKSKTNKSKETGIEKEPPPSKKIKTEQTFQRAKSKSPLSKLQWKKPSPKTCKQNKRLTEIDKLLMDEGAVNMIYQLTPEAPKGKKNMKTKAEFIKKIQSSTPNSKEMKFRERKKESKYEEGEARKILGLKQRPSLSSSVKSPSVCEDFEAHSADDSIIYRRHSSSSYSSSCMSPRCLSDVESSNQSAIRNPSQSTDGQNQPTSEGNSNRPIAEVFMPDSTDTVRTDTINKDDCMSIKEKLNSKLNLALNKRKRENPKVEKPSKLKKVMKSEEKSSTISGDFKYLSINFDQRLAEICVQKSGSKCNIAVSNLINTLLIQIF